MSFHLSEQTSLNGSDINDYTDVIVSEMASQITAVSSVYSTVCSGADQRKHQSSASLAFVRGIHRSPVDSPHKEPVTRNMFPFDDVIMCKCIILFYLPVLTPLITHCPLCWCYMASHICHLCPLLLTWFNFNPSMDK